MTQDIDIAVVPTHENPVRWIAALSHLPDHAASDMTGEDDPFQGDYLHAIRINDEFTIRLKSRASLTITPTAVALVSVLSC